MSGAWMGYYFLPDALESLKNNDTEAAKQQAEHVAQETEEVHDAGRGAAQSGDLEKILTLSPIEFEYAVATILRMLGMTGIQRLGGGGRFGVDIMALDESGGTILVQCKRRPATKRIGTPEIRAFIGTVHLHHRTDSKMFMTTSDYTDQARALAQLHDVRLVNGSDIVELARGQQRSIA